MFGNHKICKENSNLEGITLTAPLMRILHMTCVHLDISVLDTLLLLLKFKKMSMKEINDIKGHYT